MTPDQKERTHELRAAYIRGMNERRRSMTPEDVAAAAKDAYPITEPRSITLSNGIAMVDEDGTLSIDAPRLSPEDQAAVAELIANPLSILDE